MFLITYFKESVNLWYQFKLRIPTLHSWKMEAAAVSASSSWRMQHTYIVIDG